MASSEILNGLSRRSLIAAAAAMTGGSALAQNAPVAREKGPLVWMNMDQKELDDAYDQAVYAPNRATVLKRCVRNSELVRERLGAPRRFAYGPTAIEGLDVFPARTPNAPIMLFVHGGAWRAGLASQYHYAAETFVNAGAHYVVIDFANVGDVGGSLLHDGRPDSPGRGMDLQECGKFRRRSRTALYLRPFFGRALGGRAAHHRLAEGLRSAGKLHQGRRLRQRNVRPQAGSAVRALELREVHRRDRTEAQRAAQSRQDRGAGRGRLRHRRDARSFSARAATSPRR